MNQRFPNLSPPAGRRRDPREVLDGDRRQLVLALLRLGGSRRTAARQAGCAHTTIARTAARDRKFAAELAEAEAEARGDALKPPRGQAAEAELGRAAAWIVQRGRGEAPPMSSGPMCLEQTLSILEEFLARELKAAQ